jgi:3-hydroxyisobutyrate dehydrogenase-like beta-hydroxyacid dehydrogenase
MVWNRSKEAVEALVARGAKPAASPEEILGLDCSFSMLANDDAAESVLTKATLSNSAGTTHANLASVSPDSCSRLAKTFATAGAGYVAAPVLGRPPVARGGQLNILAAGDNGDIKRLEPYFAIIGKKTWMLGESPPTANAVKIAVNYNIIHAIQALAESITLAEAAGLDAGTFVNILTNTLFPGPVYTGYGTQIAERNYLPQAFSIELGVKDLRLAMSAAEENGLPLPTAPVLESLLLRAGADPDTKDLDWAAVAEVTRGLVKEVSRAN